MAAQNFVPPKTMSGRLRLAQIDALVSTRLGPTRGLGNSQPACFNRQLAMYLAARVGRWSTTTIGRFYDGRDHSTVCHGIQRIESLKETDPEVDALLADLERHLRLLSRESVEPTLDGRQAESTDGTPLSLSQTQLEAMAKVVAAEVCAALSEWLDATLRTRDFRGA